MKEKLIQFSLDTIAGNVQDLDHVLDQIRNLLDLNPFMRFELVISESQIIPVGLINCGNCSIELLQQSIIERPKGLGLIQKLVFEGQKFNSGLYDLEPGITIELRKNDSAKKPTLSQIVIQSNNIDADQAILTKYCNFNHKSNSKNLEISDIEFKFIPDKILLSFDQIETILKQDSFQAMQGWHRIGLKCKYLEKATNLLEKGGGRVLIPPYPVIPGLNESMIYLPSGLIIQPTVQNLWKMIPIIIVKSAFSKFTSHRMRFHI